MAESERSGNSTYDIFADWVDYQAAGANGPEDAIAPALKAIELAYMSEDVYQLGLRGSLDSTARPEDASFRRSTRKFTDSSLRLP